MMVLSPAIAAMAGGIGRRCVASVAAWARGPWFLKSVVMALCDDGGAGGGGGVVGEER